MLPVLLGAGAGGLDFLSFTNHKSELQSAADSAAISAAKEAALKGWNEKTADSIAQAMVRTNLSSDGSKRADYHAQTKVDLANRRVSVTVSQDHYPYFGASMYPSPQIQVTATASSSGSARTCLIVISESEKNALLMRGDAFLRANGCVAYSNSKKRRGISVNNSARLVSDMTCSAGGYKGTVRNFNIVPITNCPTVADPLAARGELMNKDIAGLPCDHKDALKFKKKKTAMAPGVYCGDVTIEGDSDIELQPGNYVFRNARFKVTKGSSIKGNKVSIILVGEGSGLMIKQDTEIGLSAPEEGTMAGMLIYAKPISADKKQRKFKIASKNANKLTGTVYLPNDTLIIGGDEDADGICDPEFPGDPPEGVDCETYVGDVSAWTAIVANKLRVTNGARLNVNSDYESSTVPVPDGIGPNSGTVKLIE